MALMHILPDVMVVVAASKWVKFSLKIVLLSWFYV